MRITLSRNHFDTAPEEHSQDQAGHGVSESPLRLRAFIVALLIIPLDNYWVIITEKVYRGPYPTIISLFANCVFILAILLLVNAGLRKIRQSLAFNSGELLLIYTMITVGASLAGHDMIPSVCQFLGHPWRFATPDNNWMNTWVPYLPKMLCVSDLTVLKSFYDGQSSLYINGHWKAWVRPVVLWSAFSVVLFYVMMCINTLVRKQWTDRERLTFPIVQLPVAMTDAKTNLWRNRLFWIGFAIAFSIDVVNGLAVYFPAIPAINLTITGHNLRLFMTTKPWDGIDWMPWSLYPFVIGLGYLLPADLSFSCWFFYLMWKVQMVVTRAMAWDAVPSFPFIRHQAFGGYVAIILMLTWSGKGYLKQVWLRIIGEESELDDSDEPMSYRSAAAGAAVGVLLLSLFMRWIGLSPLLCLIGFLIYFILATAIARMRAELGPPVHDLHFSGPDYMITTSGGLGNLSRGDLVGLTYFYWFNRAYRGHPMPVGIEGMKMAQVTRSSQRAFMKGIMLAALVGSLAAFWAFLHLAYKFGTAAKFYQGYGFAGEAFGRLDSWWKHPAVLEKPNWGANFAMIGGFLFCGFLGYMRTQVFGFPFHPIGYAISGSWSMNLVWLPILVAWLLKVITLKFGGLRLYKTAVPFFFGLTLGGMTIGCIWSLIGVIFNIPYFSFWGA